MDTNKNSLLMHWFYYYGQIPKSLKIFGEFDRVKNVRFNDLYDFAVASFADNLADQLLINAILNEDVDEFLNNFHEKFLEFKKEHPGAFELMKEVFLEKMKSTYLNQNAAGPTDLVMFSNRKGR